MLVLLRRRLCQGCRVVVAIVVVVLFVLHPRMMTEGCSSPLVMIQEWYLAESLMMREGLLLATPCWPTQRRRAVVPLEKVMASATYPPPQVSWGITMIVSCQPAKSQSRLADAVLFSALRSAEATETIPMGLWRVKISQPR